MSRFKIAFFLIKTRYLLSPANRRFVSVGYWADFLTFFKVRLFLSDVEIEHHVFGYQGKLTWDAVPMCFVAVIKSGKNEMQIVILLRKLNARKIFGSTAAEIGNFILYKHVCF